ncbi:uncharacterized protein PAN0_003c1799 [Moesziomyces antarcticus]|uniref:Uncharacterized protein n=1 Tax=Pseudozyma antarctica TaxID=84753 RepID=A0A5C3FJ58_PSEA2|nr:uncharacterized protein PAN0_003c1799 [Moesziomyces antarcticus]GAK63593.1 conserved hypothetical protein [Moesziomyces antarcticus]SPO44186.1 uncharacterized protein PSANT_01871 [Moesziomyces antarcticus]
MKAALRLGRKATSTKTTAQSGEPEREAAPRISDTVPRLPALLTGSAERSKGLEDAQDALGSLGGFSRLGLDDFMLASESEGQQQQKQQHQQLHASRSRLGEIPAESAGGGSSDAVPDRPNVSAAPKHAAEPSPIWKNNPNPNPNPNPDAVAEAEADAAAAPAPAAARNIIFAASAVSARLQGADRSSMGTPAAADPGLTAVDPRNPHSLQTSSDSSILPTPSTTALDDDDTPDHQPSNSSPQLPQPATALSLLRQSHDNDSITAVRNHDLTTDQTHAHLEANSSAAAGQDTTMMDRQPAYYPSQSAYTKSKAPAAPRGPSKSSVSTILESAKRAHSSKSGPSLTVHTGPLHGNTLASTSSIHTSASALVFPSSPGEGPPVEPSLFAYGASSSSSVLRIPKKKDSAASIHTTQTKKSTRSKSNDRAIIRNARGEIEWKDAPPLPPALPSSSTAPQSRRTNSPYEAVDSRSRTRSPGKPSSQTVRGSDDPRRQRSHTADVPYTAVGSSADAMPRTAPQRPRHRRRSTDDADGFHTADEDDIEAREWERKRDLENQADRLEVHRRQQAREDEERRARKRAERDRLTAEAIERERQADARKQADREARRLARETAEREEAERRYRQRQEAEARREKERQEAQRRRIQAEREAEEARIAQEKEAEERRIRKKQEAEGRRIRKEKEAEERRIRKEREAEERRIREEEEAKREAEEAVRRAEEERLAAIEAERLAKEAAIRAEREAVLEKERQLVEAKRQVEEEDRAARRAGRREDRRAQRALAAGFQPGEIDPEAQQSEDEEDVEETFDDHSDSESASEVFVDAGTEEDAEAKSGTTDSMARSTSNLDAPSSTDGSSDMPATPADEKAMSLPPPASGTDLARQPSSNASHGQVKFAPGTTGEVTPPAPPPEKMAPYRSDRFRHAVRVGARRAPATIPPSTSLLTATFAATDDEEAGDDDESGDPQIVQPNGPYREGGITYGRGWCAHGLADPSLTIDHRRYVRVARTKAAAEDETAPAEPDFDEVMYSDLGELIWSATTPDVIARLISHLDYADVKALRQTSQSIRFALGQLAGREIVLSRFLAPIGYRTWTPSKAAPEADAPVEDKDPMPLSFSDCEAFLLSFELLPEYALVGAEYARAPHKMDARYPRLARATTRAYNRVLTRLRMQPDLHVAGSARSASGETTTISSPWKPGRAGFFRTWVPSTETGGWLSDTELARCERELFIGGVWPHLQKGDVVWDCAVGDERNEGKYVFDGRYLRDLSFMFDRGGHLPSWLNAFVFAPSYYHNIIRSSDASQPVIYLDVLPWRDQIVSTMRLVQDQVETFSPQGARYRIAKWLYRAVISIEAGAVAAEGVDAGWHGRIVIETEGTAEHAKELISRCAGPAESAQTKARLLASVMDADGRPRIPKAPAPTTDAQGNRIETTTPWAIVRARSRPGLIWIRPIDMRERVVF